MRWNPILSMAVIACGALVTVLPAAGEPPSSPEVGGFPAGTCAPPHPVVLHAGFPRESAGGSPPGGGPILGMEAPLPPYLHGLTLSDEQQDKIFDLLHGQAPQVRRLVLTLHKSHSQLRDLGLSDRYDEAAARSLIEAASKAQSELALM